MLLALEVYWKNGQVVYTKFCMKKIQPLIHKVYYIFFFDIFSVCCWRMSAEAAAVFDISQKDLLIFLDEANRPEIVTPAGKYFWIQKCVQRTFFDRVSREMYETKDIKKRFLISLTKQRNC